ncbi:hypothetical protein [Virgibacillus sp. DJP39]|uniref:hypothetical protein n=1 Tax=Virgibacillus sp. DJP39 TaxID=3409790 RepID=UPI003BB56851
MTGNNERTLKETLRFGVYGGIIGGVLFGFMMQSMGQIEMIASMAGSKSLAVGWIVHMIISVIFGLGFGFLATVKMHLFLLSILYGIIIWIIGPLVMMPLMMGMGTNFANALQPEQLMSLGTHIFYVIVVALVVLLGLKNSKQDKSVS